MTADRMSFGGFRVRNTTSEIMLRFLQQRIAGGRKVAVGFANHHFVTACQTLDCTRDRHKDLVLLNDGIGMQVAAWLRFGRGFHENMNGTDFVPRLLRGAPRGRHYTVYLIGGRRDVIRRAAETISNYPECRVVGFCDGFSLWQHEAAVFEDIESLAPDILLVGLGNPLQERWIVQNWPRLHANVIVGVGALFEWMTGTRRRAPSPVRWARLEWAYRLMIDPKRLLRRYTLEAVQFASLVFFKEAGLIGRDGRS